MKVKKIQYQIKSNPKFKAFIDFSIIRAIYGFSIVGLSYLITEVFSLEFDLRTVLLPIAIIAFSNRLIKHYRNKDRKQT